MNETLKTTKMRILFFGILITFISSIMFISIPVSAANNSNKTSSVKKLHAGNVVQGITIASVDEQGRPTKIKYKRDSDLTPEKVDKILDIQGNANMNYIKNPPKYKKYTYGNAPTDVKTKYEADAKSVNAKISSSDEIIVPNNSSSIKPDSYTIGGIDMTPLGMVCDSYGNITTEMRYTDSGSDWIEYYYANKNTDVIGYGHITQGGKVKCLQTALSTKFGYPLQIDGIFGGATQNSVIKVQNYHTFLTSDGVVGPQTWQVIINESYYLWGFH